MALLLQGEGALRDSRVLIVGFGRIGRFLAEKLRNLGADVTVAARRPEDRALAKLMRCRAAAIGAAAVPTQWDAVVNTVPAQILGTAELDAFGDARLLELASPPYGFDLAAAAALGKRVEVYGGLSGKYAPAAAAAALRDTIYSVLED
jgi:dipicolinate synthase subunit A